MKNRWVAFTVVLSLCISVSAHAAVVSPGTPTTTVPTSLYDPLAGQTGGLPDPLDAEQFLLPIEITGADGLQDWSFDLLFDDNVVNPADVGGLYQSVYQAEFNAGDPTLSQITSSGFLGGSLDGIAGFSSGVSGNGLLAFILFAYVPGQQENDPQFSVANVVIQQAPEPASLALLAVGLMVLAVARGRTRRRARAF